MKYSTRKFVLAFVAAAMMGMPCIAQDESHSVWKRLPDMAVPRWEAGSVVFENKLYVFGGYKMPTKACKRVDVFDPKDNSWRKLADLPSAISHMNPVLDGRTVWIAGGFKDGYKGYAISEVWRYDIDKNTYTAGPSLPEPRASGGFAIVGCKLHYTGGMAQVGEKRWIDNKITVLTSEGKWKHAGELPQPLSAAAAGILDGKLYLAGGSPNGATPQPGMWVRIAP